MKFIVQGLDKSQGLNKSFEVEAPIEDEASMSDFIKEVEKRAPKGIMMILNAIKNEKNIYQLIESDIVTSPVTRIIDNELLCSIGCSDISIRFQQKQGKNIMDCRSYQSLAIPKGILEIQYKQAINQMKFQYSADDMTVNVFL